MGSTGFEIDPTQDIHIVNISVGTHPGLERKEEERLIQSVEKLWDAGVTVVVSSGNYGPKERTVLRREAAGK